MILTGIDSEAIHQNSLFGIYGAEDRPEKLMNVLDQINQRYGRNTLSIYTTGKNNKWMMRRENMSPCYTTKWQDAPIAYAH